MRKGIGLAALLVIGLGFSARAQKPDNDMPLFVADDDGVVLRVPKGWKLNIYGAVWDVGSKTLTLGSAPPSCTTITAPSPSSVPPQGWPCYGVSSFSFQTGICFQGGSTLVPSH